MIASGSTQCLWGAEVGDLFTGGGMLSGTFNDVGTLPFVHNHRD